MQTTQPTQIKSGWVTTEFWGTIGSSIAGILMALGYLTPEQADGFVEALVSVIGGLLTISATVAYIYGRIQLKRDIVQNGSQTTRVLENVSVSGVPVEGLSPELYVESALQNPSTIEG